MTIHPTTADKTDRKTELARPGWRKRTSRGTVTTLVLKS
jgi:hypothetical protein